MVDVQRVELCEPKQLGYSQSRLRSGLDIRSIGPAPRYRTWLVPVATGICSHLTFGSIRQASGIFCRQAPFRLASEEINRGTLLFLSRHGGFSCLSGAPREYRSLFFWLKAR
jgi:hypothetical protein